MSLTMFTVGKIVNTHGIRGELKIVPQTDFPEIRFAKGSALFMLEPEHHTQITAVVESARLHKNVYIVKFAGFDEINEVERFKGWELKVGEDQLVDLPEDEYYLHEIMGCTVVTEDGEQLGKITDILSPGANDVWVVSLDQGGQVLLPVIDDVVLNVDIEGKLVRIHLMEGLLPT